MWMRAPGVSVPSRTHWQRIAPASPASRCARTCAHGLAMSMTRLPGRSVPGSDAASLARSIPYLAISSAALAVRASASGGVTPSASAFASSLRTRSSRALGGSECIRNLQVDPVELSIEPYPHHTTILSPSPPGRPEFPSSLVARRRLLAPQSRRERAPLARGGSALRLAGNSVAGVVVIGMREPCRVLALYTRHHYGCSDLAQHLVRGLCPARRRGGLGRRHRGLAARGCHGQPLRAD